MNTLQQSISSLCGSPVSQFTTVQGGDICQAYQAKLSNGQQVFIKTHHNAQLLEAEAAGLAWLAAAKSFPTPNVLGQTSLPHGGMLALTWIDARPPQAQHWQQFAHCLASLHRSHVEQFGWHRNNFIGTVPQHNTPTQCWVQFFREQRLLPQIRWIIDSRTAESTLLRRFQPLLNDLENRLGNPEKPCRIHGDLWSGNHLFDQKGTPFLIDPAPYAGHREVDLAMMKLFGGYPKKCFRAYQEMYPLQPEWEYRIAIYQLYFLLAHVNIHGAEWMSAVLTKLNKLV